MFIIVKGNIPDSTVTSTTTFTKNDDSTTYANSSNDSYSITTSVIDSDLNYNSIISKLESYASVDTLIYELKRAAILKWERNRWYNPSKIPLLKGCKKHDTRKVIRNQLRYKFKKQIIE